MTVIDAMHSRYDIGQVRLDCVVESHEPLLDPFELYPDATPAHIEANIGWLAPRFYDPVARKLIIPIQGFVLRSAGKTIVVDTCVGDCKARKRADFDNQQWNWLDRLAQAGVRPEDVDYVVCTHFHVDHVGWNTRLADGRWVPTFPNARYLFTQAEWDFWWSEKGLPGRERSGDYVTDSVLPIVDAGLADFVAPDQRLSDEVQLIPAAGHTPGLVAVGIRSNGAEAVLASDIVHSPLQLAYPHWSTRFCADADHSRRTRMAFLERHADTNVLVVPAHFPSPTAGYIERAGEAYRFRYA